MPSKKTDTTLTMMIEDMATAPDMFKPTHYWEVLLPRILERINRHGLRNIKYHPHFVPIYCSGTYRERSSFYRLISNVIGVVLPRGRVVRRGILNHLLGYNEAHLDYNLFRSVDLELQAPILSNVSESSYGLDDDRPGFLFEFNDNKYSKGMLKYLKSLAFLKRSVDTSSMSSVLEIGGGLVPLAEILKQAEGADYFYVGVDIPPMAYVASDYLSHIYGAENVLDYSESRKLDVIDLDELRKSYSAVMLCPWQLPKVKGNIDLFVNSTSFQEMEPDVVQNYANLVTELITSYVLINNRIAGQPVAVGAERGVKSVTTIDYIIGCFPDFEIVDRSTWLAANESEIVVMRREPG